MRISYSALDTYQTCPLKYKFQEVERIKVPKSKEAVFGTALHETMKFIHSPGIIYPNLEKAMEHFSNIWNPAVFDDETEERSAFSQGIRIIDDYFKKNNPSDSNIVDLESRFQIGIMNGEHTVSGVIDRIDKTLEGYEIIDYKTTRKMPSQERIDNDVQLSIYLLAFLKRYPKEEENLDKIMVSLYFLKHGVKLSSLRTLEQLKEIESLFSEVIQLIESGKFEPKVGPLCDWCGYQKMCPMWKHKFKELRKINSDEIRNAINEYIELKSAVKLTDDRLGKLQDIIDRYMDQEEVERVFGDNGIIQKMMRKSYSYDKEKIRQILEPLNMWEDVIKLDGIALRKVIETLSKEVRKKISEAESVKETRGIIFKKK